MQWGFSFPLVRTNPVDLVVNSDNARQELIHKNIEKEIRSYTCKNNS
jgi:hypothetical protein